MNIQNLVSEVLTEIAGGINLAQGKSPESETIVVPKYTRSTGNSANHDRTTGRMAHLVSFELTFTVEASEASSKDGKIRLGTSLIGGSGNVSDGDTRSDSRNQKILFSIPVLWPSHDGSNGTNFQI